MLTKEDILEYLAEQKSFFKEKYNIIKLGIFGSFARDEQTDQSDIDLIIQMEEDTPNIFEKKLEIKNKFKEKYNRDVDICTEKYIKPVLKKYILKDVIYV